MSTSPAKPEPVPGTPDARCPSCERFIGPADACPYCGADSARGPALRRLRYAAALVAVLGLAGLIATAVRSDPPAIKIGGISPAMNFAYVRIAGRVVKEPTVLREGGEVDYVSLTVGDGTGQVRVQADGPVALALERGGGIPARGARVEVVGSLSVSAGGPPRLRLQSVRQLRIVEGS